MSTENPASKEVDEQAANLSRESRPERRGYVNVTRGKGGSIDEVVVTCGYGGYDNRGPSRTDLELSYRVDDGVAHVTRVEDATSGRKYHWISTEAFRVLPLAEALVERVPDVDEVRNFEVDLAEQRSIYVAEIRQRCDENGCLDQVDSALGRGFCRKHDPETPR